MSRTPRGRPLPTAAEIAQQLQEAEAQLAELQRQRKDRARQLHTQYTRTELIEMADRLLGVNSLHGSSAHSRAATTRIVTSIVDHELPIGTLQRTVWRLQHRNAERAHDDA